MNLPNKLTVSRMVMVPFVVACMLADGLGVWTKWVALALFIIAAVTDLFDGKIARKYNLVTNFGKFMDPLADKMLVCSTLICLVEMGRIPSWMVIIIIAREFIISGFRLVASDQGVVIAASMWGKVKTVFQLVTIGFLIANIDLFIFRIAEQVLIWISLALTVISLIDYIIKNKDVLKTEG